MVISIETALKRGYNRTIARNGLVLAGVLFVVSTINAIVGAGVAQWMANQATVPMTGSFMGGMRTALFGVPPVVGGIVSLITGLALVVLTIGALRTFVSDETETLPQEYFTQNIVWPGLNFIVGSIVFGIVVGIGLVLFLVPGLFLLVALGFWSVYVAVEDRNFIEGMQDSWALTRGHRLRLFLLVVAVVIIGIVVSMVFGILGFAGGIIGILFVQIGSALTTIFSLATLASVYNQLVALPPESDMAPTDDTTHTPA